jgi:hypothetical protein
LDVEEMPEMLAAIEAVRSFDADKDVGIEEARRRGAFGCAGPDVDTSVPL